VEVVAVGFVVLVVVFVLVAVSFIVVVVVDADIVDVEHLREHDVHPLHDLVDLRIGMERSRWLAYGALSQLLTDHPEGLMMSSIAKLVGAEDLIANATNLMKLYGSLGYHNGRVAELMKNALGFASVGGTEEMHRKNIFNQMKRLAG